jgi:hypothetical protein
MIANAEPQFGPWRAKGHTERRCRWHVMTSLAHVYLGPDHPLTLACAAASSDRNPIAALEAWRELQALAPLPRRRLLATYGALERRVRGDRPRRRA